MRFNETIASALCLAALVLAHDGHQDQTPILGPHPGLWYTAFDNIPGDGGTQADSVFSGISTFGRLPYFPCLASDERKYDIAFIGAPFDTGTSYRPGARFGPQGIQISPTRVYTFQSTYKLAQASDKVLDVSICSTFFDGGKHTLTNCFPAGEKGSRKVRFSGGYNVPLDTNPFNCWAKVLDCGDIPVTSCVTPDIVPAQETNYDNSYDNAYAIQQIEEGHSKLLTRTPFTNADEPGPSKAGRTLPRIITLGGDHTITLPLLRSVVAAYGPISVIHFDSHLDTWRPRVFGGAPSPQASINHGTYFYHAHREGLLANDTNIHAGIRTTLSGPSDYDHDGYCGFEIVEAREIDTIGTEGIIRKIRER
ncbi:MAG: hypothetical protein L6R39_005367, partial [Caloplaca ligustica]